jgi:hypothetical protein
MAWPAFCFILRKYSAGELRAFTEITQVGGLS